MATSKEYKDYVLERLQECVASLSGDSKGGVESYTFSARKMFGEYCVYIQDSKSMQKPKALFLLCDECVFVKQYKILESLLAHSQKAKPYPCAKEWYMIDYKRLSQLLPRFYVLKILKHRNISDFIL